MAPFFVSNYQVTTMRHFLIGFALVCAVGFGGEAFAAVVQFPAAATPTEALTKPKLIPKLSVGGTVVPLHRANKLNPWSAALALGSAAAMLYFEDELTATPYELFLGDTPPPDPEGTTGGFPEGYYEGYYWYVRGGSTVHFSSASEVVSANCTEPPVTWYYKTDTSWKYRCLTVYGWYDTQYADRASCGSSGSQACTNPTQEPKQWPNDGKVTAWIDPNTRTIVKPDGEMETVSFEAFENYYKTENGVGQASLKDGVLTIKEWLELTDGAGNTVTVEEWAQVNAATGEVLGTGQTSSPGGITSVAPAPAPLEIPTDYARENTLGEIRDALSLTDPIPGDPALSMSIPSSPETAWDLTNEHTSFWSWMRTTFPFSLLTSPLAAINASTPAAPQFCYTAIGIEKCHSMSMWDPLFSAIRFAEGLLLIFGFYLVMVRAVMRFGG